VIVATPQHNDRLRAGLKALSAHDRDYWSFRNNAHREHGHGLFQYPAMMVPQVARAVLNEACKVHPEIERVGDPFVGSGTMLTESMLRGLSFTGIDINPLAILLCRTKAGPFFIDALKEKAAEVNGRIHADRRSGVEIDFPNRDKWFRRDVQRALSKIRRAIVGERALWARRFFWIALAEAVRLTSNSRTSTFKLHIRCERERQSRDCDPIAVFRRTMNRNLNHLGVQASLLSCAGHLRQGRYKMTAEVTLGDSRQTRGHDQWDIVVTSPPYGDNATTVPYGQYSYLPLQWIDLADIDPGADAGCLRSTHEIDTRSLGGRKRVEITDQQVLSDRSVAFRRYLASLRDEPPDRAKRVTAFFRDLAACIDPVSRRLRAGGLIVWIIGNRKVGGRRMPLDDILAELLGSQNVLLLCRLTRTIPSKRMALKNNIADTMSTESILVMRKAVCHGEGG